VAREHYLQTTDDHFRDAVAGNSVATSKKAAQNPAHQAAEMGPNATNIENENATTPEKPRVLRKSTGADGNRTHLAPLQTPHRV